MEKERIVGYFSIMASRYGDWPRIREVTFASRKYGLELLVDAALISEMPSFIDWDEPYRLDFYDLTLVIRGTGEYRLDEASFPVRPGTVFFTAPGQVRRWLTRDLEAECVFFPAEFFEEHFTDPLFLHRLLYFHDPRGPRSLSLDVGQLAIRRRFEAMRREISHLRTDSSDYLRAVLYEILIRLNRAYTDRHGLVQDGGEGRLVWRFLQMVDRELRAEHRVSGYARRLGVTPGHLNLRAKQRLGQTAGALIRARLIIEAKRALRHSGRSVSAIAHDLGFRDASYFARFFRREVGVSPSRYRRPSKPAGQSGARPP